MRFIWFSLLISAVVKFSFVNAQIEITDSHGKYQFTQAPKRVVVLNWALAEQMLELGVTPLGMADVDGFRQHADKPTIENNIVDVGNRLNPNLSKIKELKPEIILIGYSQRPLIKSLSNIATVIYFKNFGKRYNNYQKSKDHFLELATLFDKTNIAHERLQQLELDLGVLKKSLQNSFNSKYQFKTDDAEAEVGDNVLPYPLIVFSVPNTGRVTWVFGKNSMPYYAAQALGLRIVDVGETDKFGVVRLQGNELEELVTIEHNRLELEPKRTASDLSICNFKLSSFSNDTAAQLDVDNQLGCGGDLAYQNPFGGVMSVLYLATALHDALIAELANN